MNNIEIKVMTLNPSNNINPQIIFDQFYWRRSHKYFGIDTIQIGDVKEPIWWNRPIVTNKAVKKEADGLYSYNLPYIYTDRLFKSKYNLLVGEGSVPLMLLIKINPKWTPNQRAQ